MMNPRAMQFMGLNAVRALSLISLILVFASTILVMVTNIKAVNSFDANNSGNSTMLDCDYIDGSTVPNQPAGVFWAVVASLLIVFQTIILFLSECSWPMAFFDRFFPVLGSEFGLGALGIFQCLISTQILSHHVDDFTLVSAFFLFALGCLNMLLGLIFRESAKRKRSVTSWRAEAKGVLPTKVDRVAFVPSDPFMSSVYSTEKQPQMMRHDSTTSMDKTSFGFGRQGEKAANLRGFVLRAPEESLPRYIAPPPASSRGVSRSPSSASSSSSFYSHERESTAGHGRAHPPALRREGEEAPSRSDTPVLRSNPPSF